MSLGKTQSGSLADLDEFLMPELPKVNLYEKVLFRETDSGEKAAEEYILLDRTKWVEVCKEYAELPDFMKHLDYVTNCRLWHLSEHGKCLDIIKDYEWLKKKEPELFKKIFTVSFAMQLLYEASITSGDCERNKQKLICWIAQNMPTEITQTDFWSYIEKWQEFQGIKQSNFFAGKLEFNFVKNWKRCFGLELEIDLKQKVQRKYIEELFEKMSIMVSCPGFGFGGTDAWQLPMDYKTNFMNLLSEFESFQGNRMPYFQNFIEELVREGDKEVLHKALVKNFISRDMVKKCMEIIWKTEKYDLVPMFILKKYDGA